MNTTMSRKTTKRGTATPAGRLIEARENAGYETAVEACEKLGFSHSSYGQHESGARGLKNAAKRYAKAFGVDENWLLHGEDEAPSHEVATVQKIPAVVKRGIRSARAGEGVTLVRRYSGNGSAGDPVPFPDALLQAHGLTGRQCTVVQIDKTSETADLHPGDFILLDTKDVDPATPGQFAVEADGTPFAIRHLQYLVGSEPAKLLVRTEGPQPHQHEVEFHALRILGRVRWIAKSI